MDIHVHIHCPDLVSAASLMASRMGKPVKLDDAPKKTQKAKPESTPTTAPTTAPEPAQEPVKPKHTAREIVEAGAALLQANRGLQPVLNELLQKYGVKAAMDLKTDQLDAFAADLRGLGADI